MTSMSNILGMPPQMQGLGQNSLIRMVNDQIPNQMPSLTANTMGQFANGSSPQMLNEAGSNAHFF